jgi:hypothetical protein
MHQVIASTIVWNKKEITHQLPFNEKVLLNSKFNDEFTLKMVPKHMFDSILIRNNVRVELKFNTLTNDKSFKIDKFDFVLTVD